MKTAAKTRHLYREVSGVRVHYREAGVPGSTAVVLVHGFPSSSYSFRGVLPLIGEHAYVIAPDLPGSGFTEAPAYHQDLDTVDIHIYDGGHHLLETHSAEVAEQIITFIGNL